MLNTLAQLGIPASGANEMAKALPKPEGPTQTILWAVIGIVLLIVVFGFVIKMKMNGDR
jgi:uncharacterized membrane protein YjfL (UPF0719 family)